MNKNQEATVKKAFDVEVGQLIGVTRLDNIEGVRVELTKVGSVYSKEDGYLVVQFDNYRECVADYEILSGKAIILKEGK